MRPKIHLISCFLLVLILGFHLGGPVQAQRAQQGAGNIQGTVTDASGGVIPGVDVTARNVATGIERMIGEQRQRLLPDPGPADRRI